MAVQVQSTDDRAVQCMFVQEILIIFWGPLNLTAMGGGRCIQVTAVTGSTVFMSILRGPTL